MEGIESYIQYLELEKIPSFAIGFAVQKNIDYSIKIGVISITLLIIGIGIIMDMRMKRQKRSFSF